MRWIVWVALVVVPVCLWAQDAPPHPAARVSTGHIISKVDPIYPFDAKRAHVEGVVALHAIIGRDGRIEHLSYISGPDMLKDAAIDAVKQWVYSLFLLDGKPMEVDTTIRVNFNLGGGSPEPSPGGSLLPEPRAVRPPLYELPPADPARPRISSAVMAGRVTKRVNPKYSPEQMTRGVVILRVMIGRDGKVQDVMALAGLKELWAPATEAMRQWEFEPYVLNGEPADVETVITMKPN